MSRYVLYYKPTCPFCHRVIDAAEEMGFRFDQMRDISSDEAARAELVEVGGKQQVPCLFVDGKPLYESSAIVDFMRAEKQA